MTSKDKFEEKLSEFQECCQKAQDRDLSIDQLMDLYVEGKKLHSQCLEILDQKKQKFETITAEE